MNRVAIVDLGTNTFHLLIAEIDASELRILHKEKQSVKIGEKGISKGLIVPTAQDRALNALQGFKAKIEAHQVDEIHTTATSAFRNAANGREFADKIQRLTGIHINIIDGKKEAQLIYQGVRQAVEINISGALIMDIGGGSVEFIIAKSDEIQWMQSFEIGAQRLMDKFHHHDPITAEEIDQLESFLDTELRELISAYHRYQPGDLIGASGTFDTLSQIYCLREGIEPGEGPRQPLTIQGFHDIHQDLISKTRSQRMDIPGMIEMRVDMIVVASSLIYFILKKFRFARISVSSYALKEGLLYQVVQAFRNR